MKSEDSRYIEDNINQTKEKSTLIKTRKIVVKFRNGISTEKMTEWVRKLNLRSENTTLSYHIFCTDETYSDTLTTLAGISDIGTIRILIPCLENLKTIE